MLEKYVGVRVDQATFKGLEQLAENEDRSVAQVIRHAIEHWLAIKRVQAS